MLETESAARKSPTHAPTVITWTLARSPMGGRSLSGARSGTTRLAHGVASLAVMAGAAILLGGVVGALKPPKILKPINSHTVHSAPWDSNYAPWRHRETGGV